MATVLFSGRFDPPHCGHVATIMKLSEMFEKVVVPVLDHEGQSMPVDDRVEILDACTAKNVVVFSNNTHYARISRDEIEDEWYGSFPDGGDDEEYDIYASGNEECIENMKKLGYAVLYIPRSFNYSGTEERAKAKCE